MLKSVFIKTIYIKRWSTLAWSVGLAALVIFTIIFYPSLSKSFSEALTNVPDSLKTFIGDSNAYKTIAGYTDVQIYSQYAFMTLIFGIMLLTGLLAGEEGEGILQTLLAQPLRRSRIYFQKLFSGALLLAVTCLSITIGTLIGAALIGEHLSLDRLIVATFSLWLITMVFSVIGYVLGAAFGRRALAGGLAGALAFVSLLVTSLASSIKPLKTIDKISPFHYFNRPGILQYGPNWGDLAILAAVVVTIAWLGVYYFKKRDIYLK